MVLVILKNQADINRNNDQSNVFTNKPMSLSNKPPSHFSSLLNRSPRRRIKPFDDFNVYPKDISLAGEKQEFSVR